MSNTTGVFFSLLALLLKTDVCYYNDNGPHVHPLLKCDLFLDVLSGQKMQVDAGVNTQDNLNGIGSVRTREEWSGLNLSQLDMQSVNCNHIQLNSLDS